MGGKQVELLPAARHAESAGDECRNGHAGVVGGGRQGLAYRGAEDDGRLPVKEVRGEPS